MGQIREYGPDGMLEHAGYMWCQPICWRDDFVRTSAITAIVMAGIISPFAMFCWTHRERLRFATLDIWILSVFAVCLLYVLCIFVFSRPLSYWTNEQAGVSFTPEGHIWITKGRRFFQRYSTIKCFCFYLNASEISVLDFKPMMNRAGGHYRYGGEDGYLAYAVWILFEDGEHVYVAENLDEHDAHIVVAQLNKARREIRAAVPLAA
jgi:hypothetical protein